jgi:hypothetical protein
MQVLNLIRPEKSSVKYRVIQFPDGEPHIVLENIDRKDNLSVICRVCNPTDLFILMQVGDILNRQGVSFISHIWLIRPIATLVLPIPVISSKIRYLTLSILDKANSCISSLVIAQFLFTISYFPT